MFVADEELVKFLWATKRLLSIVESFLLRVELETPSLEVPRTGDSDRGWSLLVLLRSWVL